MLEPATLIFSDLPKACGFSSIAVDRSRNQSVQSFVSALKLAIDELRIAYPELQERLRDRLREAIELPGTFQQYRTALSGRSERILLNVTEPRLRAFCLRLLDDNLNEPDWLESIGSHLALKPPSKWHDDEEEERFSSELIEFATRFRRVESIVFAQGDSGKDISAVRLSITRASGVEHERVLHFRPDEEEQIEQLQLQFDSLLKKNRRLGLAAASRAIWTNLEKEGPHD
jgi:hypothetical protein